MDAFDDGRDHAQLAHVATDGESYGHHFRYGDMALAYALHLIEKNEQVKLTIYAEFLERFPPTHEVEIHQPSAWSCPHGVDRWKRDCGCNSGGHEGWNQQWREPLRNALDWLRDKLAPIYETKAKEFLKDPWAARDDYIEVILNRSPENISRFFGEHAVHELSEADQVAALRLLEMQRHAMLMFTSCGWFFDEISGIESTQVIQYAARALQLAGELGAENLESGFLEILEQAKSNLPENQNGRAIYEKFVKPAIMTREKVAAHYAISSLFESYPEEAQIYSYNIKQEDRQLWTAGNARLAIGRIKVTFDVTRNSDVITYGALHMGEHNLNCGVRFYQGPGDYAALTQETKSRFRAGGFRGNRSGFSTNISASRITRSKTFFATSKTRCSIKFSPATREEIHNTYRLLTDRFAPLTHFLKDIHAPALGPLAPASEFVLNCPVTKTI